MNNLKTLNQNIELIKRQQEEQKKLIKRYDEIMAFLVQKEQNNSPVIKKTVL
jgi:hypothetical protein